MCGAVLVRVFGFAALALAVEWGAFFVFFTSV